MFSLFERETADEVWHDLALAFSDGKFADNPSSRGGSTAELLHVALSINDPTQRWVISRKPIMNIAFALAEVVWIMRGRQDAKFLTFFNSKLPRYTGPDALLHGAYGMRLRKGFGLDQLDRAFETFTSNPSSRQVVLQIWNPSVDLPDSKGIPASADIPCNLTSMLKIRSGKLDWTQIMRSNDLFRGLPYNIVQFTFLHEIVAGWLGLELGAYHHISDSLHIYDDSYSHFVNIRKDEQLISSDRIGCSKSESETYFEELEGFVEILIAGEIVPQHALNQVLPNLPIAYSNIATVLAAETIRRRSSHQEAADTISYCTNPVYRRMFSEWLIRVEGR